MSNNELVKAINTSLINGSLESDLGLQHKLLVNRPKHKVLTAIINELNDCDEFLISVAFITKSGVSLLLNSLSRLEECGVKGKILTGDYLNFTAPDALKKLNEFSNIEVKLITEQNFHAKGYFFRQEGNWNIILGSSNLTQAALTKTEEWNIKLSSSKDGLFVNQLLNEYQSLWNQTSCLDDVLYSYNSNYTKIKSESRLKNRLFKQYLANQEENIQISYEPNKMQAQALSSLSQLRSSGESKALIISATGTGKTILSGFDVKSFKANRMLFIVHRENIARKSMKTYKQMIKGKTFGVLTGTQKDFDADYIFTTIQTLANHKEHFAPDHFDYMIIDEVHHGGAKTYQQVYNYFTPKFSLGMTATPQRTDGFDIFTMYDNNIAFEYKLSEALHEELLAPFHYFGVSDIKVDGQLIDEKTAVNRLTSDERTKHIIEKIDFYGHCGDKVHGLIFVSKIAEAMLLSESLNKSGYRTIALSSDDSESVRLQAIDDLEAGKLDYIITVDIFNEGIDIPCINQVVLLRPTTSAIVYIQQIGRGLRKVDGKDYVVLIDFIGNYKNNYLIPIAIGNTGTYDKDKIKKEIILNGTDYLEGESVLQFEEVVQKQLIKQITNTNFSTLANIKRDYDYLKLKYGRIPTLVDFVENELISPEVILGNSYKIYAEVKAKIENIKIDLSEKEQLFLTYLSQIIFPAKRMHEIYIIKELIQNKTFSVNDLYKKINSNYIFDQSDIIENALRHLSRNIFTKCTDEYHFLPFIMEEENKVVLSNDFRESLSNRDFVMELQDIINVIEVTYINDQMNDNELFTLHKKYTRKQIYKCGLIDYHNASMSGYEETARGVLIFITLDNSSSFTSYDNGFTDEGSLIWFSKKSKFITDKNGQLTLEGRIAKNKIKSEIFVRRSKHEMYYYLGNVKKVLNFEETQTNEHKPVIKYKFELSNQLETKMLSYLTLNEIGE